MTSKDCGDDIKRISEAMDVLAKLVLEQRKENGSLQLEYQRKIDALDKLITTILRLPEGSGQWEVDKLKLARSLRDGVEIIEKPDKLNAGNGKFALIPVVDRSNTLAKQSSRKKKNRIACSFCNETGHTRAKCPKRLVYVPQRDA